MIQELPFGKNSRSGARLTCRVFSSYIFYFWKKARPRMSGSYLKKVRIFLSGREEPRSLSGAGLDNYLAGGWYRMGQTMFTVQFLRSGNRYFSALWLRLPLTSQMQFSPRLRKLLARNRRLFEVNFQPAVFDQEKENLYRRYRLFFKDPLPEEELEQGLNERRRKNKFNTWEVTIRHEGKLVAFSMFDLGKQSLASIIGVFEPRLAKYSLGLQTMLEEIEFGRQRGMRYFYPGYIVPGNPRFDYKTRIGQVEYFDRTTRKWQLLRSLNPADIPLVQMETRLEYLAKLMSAAGQEHRLWYYPHFDYYIYDQLELRLPPDLLEYPIFLEWKSLKPAEDYYVIIFDYEQQVYRLVACWGIKVNLLSTLLFWELLDSKDNFLQILKIKTELLASPDAESFVDAVVVLQSGWEEK
jgi:arginine-tRNA-protein transferase